MVMGSKVQNKCKFKIRVYIVLQVLGEQHKSSILYQQVVQIVACIKVTSLCVLNLHACSCFIWWMPGCWTVLRREYVENCAKHGGKKVAGCRHVLAPHMSQAMMDSGVS
jgi:hypothetical protein